MNLLLECFVDETCAALLISENIHFAFFSELKYTQTKDANCFLNHVNENISTITPKQLSVCI